MLHWANVTLTGALRSSEGCRWQVTQTDWLPGHIVEKSGSRGLSLLSPSSHPAPPTLFPGAPLSHVHKMHLFLLMVDEGDVGVVLNSSCECGRVQVSCASKTRGTLARSKCALIGVVGCSCTSGGQLGRNSGRKMGRTLQLGSEGPPVGRS